MGWEQGSVKNKKKNQNCLKGIDLEHSSITKKLPKFHNHVFKDKKVINLYKVGTYFLGRNLNMLILINNKMCFPLFKVFVQIPCGIPMLQLTYIWYTLHSLKKGRLSGASKVSYWKHSAQANSKRMASIQNLFTVGNLGYSLYIKPKQRCETCLK